MWSRYSYFFKKNEKCYIYSSLSNGLAEVSKSVFAEIENLKNNNLPIPEGELNEQLKKLKVWVTSDKDEYYKLKYQNLLLRNDNSRLILTINPTLACNFACPYCFEQSHSNIYMDESVENKIVNYIKGCQYAKAVSVTWFGGEPLLAFDRIVSLTRKIQQLGLAYKAGMITNGYLLTDRVVSLLPSLGIASLQITIDGLAPLHDSRRCLKTGNPTFSKILHNIKVLQDKCPEIAIRVRVNVDKTNHGDFIKLYRFLQGKHFPNLSVNLAFVKDMSGCNGCPSFYDAEEQAALAKEYLKEYGLDFSMVYPMTNRNECAIRNRNALVIGPRGELYKCWNDVGDEKRVVGNIDGQITNESLLLRYLVAADPFEDPKCQTCFLIPVCGGGCPYSRIKNEYEGTNINTCLFMKEHIDEFLKAHIEYKSKIKSENE